MTEFYGLQFDSTDPLPFTPRLQAFYYNGRFARRPASFGRGRVWVDVLGTAARECFWRDVEPGNGDPSSFGGWLDERHAAGLGWGGGYCDRARLPGMIGAAGRRPWSLWLATLDGTAEPSLIPELAALPANVTLVAVQAFPAASSGINADISVVVDRAYWEGRARAAG